MTVYFAYCNKWAALVSQKEMRKVKRVTIRKHPEPLQSLMPIRNPQETKDTNWPIGGTFNKGTIFGKDV